MSLTLVRLAGLASALMFCVLGGANAADEIAAAAQAGRILKADELSAIYRDRSWVWKDGAGYFKAANREFIAWVNDGAASSYADGSWSLTDKGRLCFRATWRAVGGSKNVETCFDHRVDDQNIYQRKLPNGKWEIFSHLPPNPDDEVQKLKLGDEVSENYQRNKLYVTENTPKRAKKSARSRTKESPLSRTKENSQGKMKENTRGKMKEKTRRDRI